MIDDANTMLHQVLNATTLLAIVNAGLGFALCALSSIYYKHTEESWKWIKLSYAFIGLYWGCLYSYVIIVNLLNLPSDTVIFGRIFVRPAITVTLGVMLAGAVIRHRKTKVG